MPRCSAGSCQYCLTCPNQQGPKKKVQPAASSLRPDISGKDEVVLPEKAYQEEMRRILVRFTKHVLENSHEYTVQEKNLQLLSEVIFLRNPNLHVTRQKILGDMMNG